MSQKNVAIVEILLAMCEARDHDVFEHYDAASNGTLGWGKLHVPEIANSMTGARESGHIGANGWPLGSRLKTGTSSSKMRETGSWR